MPSVIETIYSTDGIAGWTPQYDTDVAIAVRGVNQIKESLHSHDTPVRMLSLAPADAGGEFAFIALGKLYTVDWVVNDRLFLKATGLGEGIRDYSLNAMRYAVSYLTQIANNRSPTAQSHVRDARFEYAIREWPEGTGETYAVVDVYMTIQEVVSDA